MKTSLEKELAINFERVCVMEQRQFITMKLERQDDVPSEFMEYAGAVDAFNAAFDDHKAFETFYSSDLAHKTRENALILEKKYDFLQEKFHSVRKILNALKRI
jgi:hypothetical protein